jgi:hypothetical protein
LEAAVVAAEAVPITTRSNCLFAAMTLSLSCGCNREPKCSFRWDSTQIRIETAGEAGSILGWFDIFTFNANSWGARKKQGLRLTFGIDRHLADFVLPQLEMEKAFFR